jgi:very-short-patch-repair endonuclease
MIKPSAYDDGLDADGYPLDEPARGPYKRGDESACGDAKSLTIGAYSDKLIERLAHFREIGDSTDSPIEDILGAAVLMFFERAGTPLVLCKTLDRRSLPAGLLLVPQFRWSFYRSDWAIFNPVTGSALLIECDGKEFHSSDEQKAHDRAKDQAAADRGFLTMRFTGSQIHRRADELAQKIYDAVSA